MRRVQSHRLQLIDDMREAAVAGTVNRGSHQDLRRVRVTVVEGKTRRRAVRNVERAGVRDTVLVGGLGLIVVLIACRAGEAKIGGDGPVSGRPLVIPPRGED